MDPVCTQCLTQVPDEGGYETPQGHLLCGACYMALWGPRAVHQARAPRPKSRRPKKMRSLWAPRVHQVDPLRKRRD